MQIVALVTAILSILLAIFSWDGGSLPFYVPVSGLVLAGIVWASRPISTFLKIFVVMYALGFMFLAVTSYLGAIGLLPSGLMALLPPPFMASAAVGFAAIVYGVSFIPLIRTVMGLTDPYFDARDSQHRDFGWFSGWFPSRGAAARALVGFIIANNFIQVAMQIRLNIWYRDLFNALQAKDATAFWFQMWSVFVPLLVCWIVSQMLDIWSDSMLQIRWRTWLSRSYFSRWLGEGTHYRMQLLGLSADNPDQRIADDVDSFISQTMALSTRLLAQLATLVSFTVILWEISSGFVFPGTDIVVPGFLVWVVLAYAIIGTLFTHLIGRPLIRLDFLRQRVEANFRFALARLREYGEQVALLSGAEAEKQRLRARFGDIVDNFIALLIRRLKLVGFTFSWQQMSVAFPYILTGSYFLAGKITLGQLQQGAQSFGQVNSAMSFFITSYQTLAAYKAIIDRLTTFNDGMRQADAVGAAQPRLRDGDADHVGISDLALKLPNGRTIAALPEFSFRAGERTLVTGPSGSGKSTLFRAIAGVWPFVSGEISVPAGKSVLLLPQQPYIAQGTLREALTYPEAGKAFDDAAVRKALEAVKLGHLVAELDTDDLWAQRLSGGEKQRLSIAHALLAKPDWLFLDEATAALDEPLEAEIYRAIGEMLPETTVVSIGHRSTLVNLHQRRIDLRPGDDGISTPREMAPASA
jgi:putative ATP-binding cassette transporter